MLSLCSIIFISYSTDLGTPLSSALSPKSTCVLSPYNFDIDSPPPTAAEFTEYFNAPAMYMEKDFSQLTLSGIYLISIRIYLISIRIYLISIRIYLISIRSLFKVDYCLACVVTDRHNYTVKYKHAIYTHAFISYN